MPPIILPAGLAVNLISILMAVPSDAESIRLPVRMQRGGGTRLGGGSVAGARPENGASWGADDEARSALCLTPPTSVLCGPGRRDTCTGWYWTWPWALMPDSERGAAIHNGFGVRFTTDGGRTPSG